MLLACAFGCTCMAFDQATRERRCISECTCAMQTVSWPPTYLATCITLPLSVRGPTEKFFGGCDTICQRASQERDASLHERRVLSQRYDSAMGDRKFCEQSLRALPCTAHSYLSLRWSHLQNSNLADVQPTALARAEPANPHRHALFECSSVSRKRSVRS